jgi:N-acetylglucosamine kinase-like BadF-type ATPase
MQRTLLTISAAALGLGIGPAAACDVMGKAASARTVTTAALQIVSTAGASRTELPAIDSLTAESDFTVFMAPDVPAPVRAAALRKLWRTNPIFSQSDGLDSDFLDHR